MRRVLPCPCLVAVLLWVGVANELSAQPLPPVEPFPRVVVPVSSFHPAKHEVRPANSRPVKVHFQVFRLKESLDVQFDFPTPVLNRKQPVSPQFQSLPVAACKVFVERLLSGGQAERVAESTLRLPQGREGTAEISGVFQRQGSEESQAGGTPIRFELSVTPTTVESDGILKIRMSLNLSLVRTVQRDDALPDELHREYLDTNLEMAPGYSMLFAGVRKPEFLCFVTPSMDQGSTTPLVPEPRIDAKSENSGDDQASSGLSEEIGLLREEIRSLRQIVEQLKAD